jgi:hypothetical protein
MALFVPFSEKPEESHNSYNFFVPLAEVFRGIYSVRSHLTQIRAAGTQLLLFIGHNEDKMIRYSTPGRNFRQRVSKI